MRVKPKQREELEAILALNHQPFTFTQEECKQGPRKGQGQTVLRKVTTGRVPLTVWLIRHQNGHWYAHISFIKDGRQPDYAPVGAIGVDLNCDSIADTKVQMADGEPLVLKYRKRMFDPDWGKEEKKAWIYEQINEIVLEAKVSRCMVVLEYLDFEHCKRWLRTKLGAILTDYPNLGRDQAAAAVIGLRALEAGNVWLERKSRELAAQERARLRINRKGQFGCTVTTDGVLLDRQAEASPPLDRETDTHWFQNRVAREISGLAKAMGAFFYQKEWLPLRWRRSGPESDPWHPVVPSGDAAPSPRTNVCSTLSN